MYVVLRTLSSPTFANRGRATENRMISAPSAHHHAVLAGNSVLKPEVRVNENLAMLPNLRSEIAVFLAFAKRFHWLTCDWEDVVAKPITIRVKGTDDRQNDAPTVEDLLSKFRITSP